jgi:hypothetical protein
MFKLTGEVEEIGQFEDGTHGFIVEHEGIRIRVSGLPREYVRDLGIFLYSKVAVMIDVTADSASDE